MVLYIRCVFECNEENLSLRGDSVELCLRKKLLGVHPRVSQCLTLVRNETTYKYISMDNMQLV